MKKLVQVAVFGFALSLLTGCEGMVKVDQNEDGSVQFSLVSSLNPCDTSTGTCTVNTGTDSATDTDTDTDDSVVDGTTDTDSGADDEVVETPTTDDTDTSTVAGYVEWTPALFYADGTEMASNEISHFEVIYGATADQLTQSMTVDSAGLNSLALSQLPHGDWYVAVKTVSIYGSVSDASNVLEVSI